MLLEAPTGAYEEMKSVNCWINDFRQERKLISTITIIDSDNNINNFINNDNKYLIKQYRENYKKSLDFGDRVNSFCINKKGR